ncbi:ABC transporter substrate-binding protein [Nocardioides sp. GXZ039]|uniref:ABC transporter substrate-binding protein n=1 Tax=Nocardioides sp. GXZ039 TaxID=3136018 RepID=UPI0030F3A6DC
MALSLVTVGLLALSACGGSSSNNPSAAGQVTQNARNGTTQGAQQGGTLNMLGAGDVDYMDPNISYYSVGYLALRLWSRQLFTYPAEPGQTETAVPDLATVMPTTTNGGISADGKTYTIHLVQGAKWNTSPARQVTAADVVRGVKRTCNPQQPFGGIPDFAGLIEGYQTFCDGFAKVPTNVSAFRSYIEKTDLPGVAAPNPQTVVFHLTHPATYFVDMLTLTAFSPAPVEQLAYLPASAEQAQHTISDGPYEVKSYNPTKSIQFVRNPAWDAATDPVRHAYVDQVNIDESVSQDSIQQQLQTNTPSADMGFDMAPPPSQVPGLLAKKDPGLDLGPTSSSNPYVVFNMVSPNNGSALQNLQVRQALEYALNRDDMIRVLGGPSLNQSLTHVLPSSIDGSTSIDLYQHDDTKATDLLKQAGYPNGLTLKVLYRNQSQGSSKVFQVIQQDLSKVGIKVTGVPSPDADFYTRYLQVPTVAKRGVWDLAIAGWGADWYGDAALSFFAPLFSGAPSFPPVGSNFGFYDDPQTNKLIEQASTAKTSAESTALWAKADERVMTQAVFFPITNPQQASYHASQVHNAVYVPAFQNFDPANVWLSPDANGN